MRVHETPTSDPTNSSEGVATCPTQSRKARKSQFQLYGMRGRATHRDGVRRRRADYGSEGWGFESLRARESAGHSVGDPRLISGPAKFGTQIGADLAGSYPAGSPIPRSVHLLNRRTGQHEHRSS